MPQGHHRLSASSASSVSDLTPQEQSLIERYDKLRIKLHEIRSKQQHADTAASSSAMDVDGNEASVELSSSTMGDVALSKLKHPLEKAGNAEPADKHRLLKRRRLSRIAHHSSTVDEPEQNDFSSVGGGGAKAKEEDHDAMEVDVIGMNIFDSDNKFIRKVRRLHNSLCVMSSATRLLTGEPFELPSFLNLKQKLSIVRNRLDPIVEQAGSEAWGKHTAFTNLSGLVVRDIREKFAIELGTTAWAKLYEILHDYPIVQPQMLSKGKFNTLHLCEAPGSFVCAMNHYFQTVVVPKSEVPVELNWMANSLNPATVHDQFMVRDTRLIDQTRDRWLWGQDETGDITKVANIRKIWEVAGKFNCDFVTADGNVNSTSDPNEQESLNAPLIFCEAVCALGAVAVGGSLTLRFYTILEHQMISLVYLIACHFDQVFLLKPCSTRMSNAEVYIVALGYRGIADSVLEQLMSVVETLQGQADPVQFFAHQSLVPKETIPDDFLFSLHDASQFFAEVQSQAILRNIQLWKSFPASEREETHQIRRDFSLRFGDEFEILQLPKEQRVVQSIYLSGGFNPSASPAPASSFRRFSDSSSHSGIPSSPEHSVGSRSPFSSPGLSYPQLTPATSARRKSLDNLELPPVLGLSSPPFPDATPAPAMLEPIKQLVRMATQREIEDFFAMLKRPMFDKTNVSSYTLQHYVVTWSPKCDLSLLFVLQSGVYLILADDPSMTPFKIKDCKVPQRRSPTPAFLDRTMAIGHLVIDRVENQNIYRFLITDLVMIEGNLLWSTALNKRLQMAKIEVVNMAKKYASDLQLRAPVSLRIMNMFTLDQLASVFTMLPQITHDHEGLEFFYTFEDKIDSLDAMPPLVLRCDVSSSDASKFTQDEIVALSAQLAPLSSAVINLQRRPSTESTGSVEASPSSTPLSR